RDRPTVRTPSEMLLELCLLLAGEWFAHPLRCEQEECLVVVHGVGIVHGTPPPGDNSSRRRIRARQIYVDVAFAVRPIASPISAAEKPDAAISRAVRASVGSSARAARRRSLSSVRTAISSGDTASDRSTRRVCLRVATVSRRPR